MNTEIRRHSPENPWTYPLLEARQAQITQHVLTGGQGALLLSELAPVITTGRRTDPKDIQSPLLVHAVERGGLATYHGPGQWVLFAVDRLQNLTGDSRGVRLMIQSLLEIALEVARNHEPRSEIREGAQLGVWTPRGKVAAVGIRIKQGVVQHGLSINGFRTPESFVGLRPCGLDLPVDYLLPGVTPTLEDSHFDDLGQEVLKSAEARLTKFKVAGYS